MQDDGTGIYTSCCALGQDTRGALRMEVHTMSFLLCCLLALAIPANSLKCYKCVGNDNECSPTEETCPGQNDVCSSSALHIDSFPCKVRKVFKGCINSTTTTNKLSISPSQLVTFSLQHETCNSDLCNKIISDLDSNRNDLYCHSCISPEINCDSDKMNEMRCTGEQNLCVDMSVIGSFGDIADVSIKGCAHLPSCKENMAFSSQTSSVTIRCCNGNFCNSVIEYEPEDKTPNGIQCYSCNTLDGAECSPGKLDKAQCYGALTSCLHIEGTVTKDGRHIPTMIKGCATPSMCDSSVLPLLQKLEATTVNCCNGSLCNNQSSDSSLQGSGYFPTGNASPGTGIQNTSSSDATHGETFRRRKRSGSTVKTGHHANSKYGTGSSSTYHNDDGSSEFNGPIMCPGNSNTQGIKGGSWNSNSNSGYPNPSFNSESESHTVPNSINYSSGESNFSTLSLGGSAVGEEGAPHTSNSSDSDVSSIMDKPPTFSDLNSGDSSNGTNSYNDFNNYESGSFTEIVYVDIDLNNGQPGSPTVAPGSMDSNSYDSEIVYVDIDLNNGQPGSPTEAPGSMDSNSYDSVGNSGTVTSAYNPNIVLSANNNGSTQHLAPETVKPHNSGVKQPNAGHGSNIYNTGIGNNNGSGNLSSSGNNSAGSRNNSSAGTSGSSSFGGYTNMPGGNKSSTPYTSSGNGNSSDSDVSSITDEPPTFSDLNSYGDSSNGTNSYYDNIVNDQDNNDFNNYESGSFTEIVYVDIDLNNGQPGSPTEAPGSMDSNSYDSVGSSGTVTSAYNPNIVLSANNNGSTQHLAPETVKPHNSGVKQPNSGHGSNIYNTGIANNNGSGNLSSSGNNSAGSGNNSSAGTPGSSSFGGYTNMPGGNKSSTLYTSSGNGTGMTSEWNNNNNSSNQNMVLPIGYVNIPGSNHSSPSQNSSDYGTGITNEWIYSNDSNHNMAAPVGYNNISTNNHSSTYYTGNGTGMTYEGIHSSSSNHSMSVPGGYANVSGGNGSSTSYASSGNGTGMTYEGINSSSSNHSMSVPGGYANVSGGNGSSTSYASYGNGTGMTYEGINSSSSNHSMSVPGGYANVSGGNGSSTSYASSGNGTGMTHEGINSSSSNHSMSLPGGYANVSGGNGSSTSYASSGNGTGMTHEGINSSSSNHSMSVPGGYANVSGGNGSLTSYASYGNGTGMTHEGINSSSSNHSMSVPGGYANVSGGNVSSTSYASYGNGTGMTHEGINSSSSNHSMSVPGGSANVSGGNGSSTSYASYGNETGMTHEGINSSSSNHSMSVPGGYANVSGGNGSSTSYASSGNGTGMTHEGINSSSSNHSMSVPGGYANVSGGNVSSTSYASYGNGTGMTHEGINSSSSNHSMSVPGGYANVSGGNVSSTSYASYGNGTGMTYEGINSSSSDHSMSVPGGYANVSGGNGSSTSYAGNETVPGGSSYSNGTAWIYSSGFNPNMLPNSNGSFSNYSGIQDFLSKLNGSFNESIRNNSYFLNHLPPGMNLNGSGPYNINESLADYFNSLGLENNPNLTSVISGGNNGSLNNGDFYNNGINMGHESVNSSSYNPNMMITGVGSGGTDNNGNNMDHGLNGSMLGTGSNTNELVPGRYTNDSTIGDAGNSTGNGTQYNGASSPWAKSGSFVFFSAIVLLVLS